MGVDMEGVVPAPSWYQDITPAPGVYYYSVNACLFPLCAAHGLAITTVEGVGNPKTGLHDIQKRLIESHGLQCGFCTPGVVMTMFTLLRNNPQPTREQVEKALEGNLCRCTGYRPILDALKPFTQGDCPMGDQCCKNQETEAKDCERADLGTDQDTTQVPIFPPELQLNEAFYRKSVQFKADPWTWIRPTSLAELLVVKNKHPNAPVIMGNTTAALQIKLGKFNNTPVLLYGGDIPMLKEASLTDAGLVVGAAVTLSELEQHIQDFAVEIDEGEMRHFDCILDMIGQYGVDQIRNVATLGGSIMSMMSNSDVVTIMTALKAFVTVASVEGERVVPLECVTLKDNEVVKSVTIPHSTGNCFYGFFKQAKRRTFSSAIINSGMFVLISQDKKVEQIRMCFGGVTERIFLSTSAAARAIGRLWDDTLLQSMIDCLGNELSSATDMSAGNNEYKMAVAAAFWFKFFTKVKSQIYKMPEDVKLLLPIELTPATSSQYYDPCTDPGQSDDDALSRPVPSVSSESIVAGEALYLDDMPKIEGELFLSLVCSRRAHARIKNVDTSKALKVNGVHSYVDHTDIPGKNLWGCIDVDEEIFASKEVLCVGQPIGGILAESRDIARQASFLVEVEYEKLKPILTIQEAIEAKSFLGDVISQVDGDVETAFTESDHVLTGEYYLGHQEHMYMEPQGAFAIPRGENTEIDIYCGSHTLDLDQGVISEALNISRNKVTCKLRRLGGSFGGKETRSVMVSCPTAIAAHKTKRPVRCVLPREVDMEITGKRHPFLAKYKVGFMKDGRIKSLDIKLYSNGGYSVDGSGAIMSYAILCFGNAYKIPNVKVDGFVCKTNTPSNTSFRGFGSPQVHLITEEILFNMACYLDKVPEEIREINMYREGDLTPYGSELVNCTVRELWEKCSERSNYRQRLEEVKQLNAENKWKKRGIAITTTKFGVGVMPLFLNQASALVNIYKDGTVLLTHGGIEMGQGINTKMIQIASRALGISINKIYTSETGTHTIPNSSFTGASAGTDLWGPAVLDACNVLIKRLEPIRTANSGASWEDLITKAYFDRVQLMATGFSRKDKLEYIADTDNPSPRFEYYTYGVACTEVELDVLTGEHQVRQADIVMDCGKSLNPAIDIGQIEGGFIQGMGMVTTEEIDIDENGKTTNCSPVSYKIPNVRSIPRKFNVTLLKNHDFVTTCYSSKGISEPPLLLSVSVIMAIKEAVKAARADIGLLGHFRLDSPATVERIRTACGDQLKKTLAE